jgi:hypothetical protein
MSIWAQKQLMMRAREVDVRQPVVLLKYRADVPQILLQPQQSSMPLAESLEVSICPETVMVSSGTGIGTMVMAPTATICPVLLPYR